MKVETLFRDELWVAQMNSLGKKNLPSALATAAQSVGVGIPQEEIPQFKIDQSPGLLSLGRLALGIKSKDKVGHPVLNVAVPTIVAHAEEFLGKINVETHDRTEERRLAEYAVIQSMVHMVLQSIPNLDGISASSIQDEFTRLYI
jgi:hypothetical protein